VIEDRDLSRIAAFTDGVVAVAITLLVLNLTVPDLARNSASELWDRLGDLGDDALAYALAFALVGRFWVLHHRLFERLRSFDGQLMALNLVFLFLIALMPFSAELQARHGDLVPADVIFASTLFLTALTHWWMAVHAQRAGLERSPDPSRRATPFMALLFLASIPVAFASPIAAQAMWVGSIVVRGLQPRGLGRRSATSE
jgi:TMEM175 potassium channel family protein